MMFSIVWREDTGYFASGTPWTYHNALVSGRAYATRRQARARVQILARSSLSPADLGALGFWSAASVEARQIIADHDAAWKRRAR